MSNIVVSSLAFFFVFVTCCHGSDSSTVSEIHGCPSNLKRDKYLTSYNHRCYTFHASLKNAEKAEETCKNDGGNLVTLKSKDVNDFIHKWLESILTSPNRYTNVWLGLKDNGLKKYVWSDGSMLDHSKEFENFAKGHGTNWARSPPINTHKQCVVMERSTGKWSEEICISKKKGHTRAFICEFKNSLQNCPSNLKRNKFLVSHKNRCYNFHNRLEEFQVADKQCKTDGGYLVTIKSQEINDFLRDWLHQVKDADKFRKEKKWKFFSDSYWIGLYAKRLTPYAWADGTNVKYQKFQWKNPKRDYNKDCYSYTYEWHLWKFSCQGKHPKHEFICEFKHTKLQ